MDYGIPKSQFPVMIEGNNGGDYLLFAPAGGNLVAIEIGHQCVVTVKKVMPVEILTAILSRWEDQPLPWDIEFNNDLFESVRDWERIDE